MLEEVQAAQREANKRNNKGLKQAMSGVGGWVPGGGPGAVMCCQLGTHTCLPEWLKEGGR